ncbi:hypothetical protein DFH08DRAFT_879438 [Mycena albidolilacea]|uniref:EamA domain-containing protein n=1 Tax=Mycena albidolilacea TaxID=1033008 RepID=A0AAD6ZR62_9AGAR|nr:hypothetical protein DFH08DRAFT_879438 [Mycena albidolilacea]
MPSESRHPYIALTPNHADFSLQPLTGPAAESSTSFTTFLPDAPDVPNVWWQSVLRSVRGFLSLNAGLLLVTGACAGLSLVNVAVKTLQNLDEPVSTLELILVRMGITYICSVAYMLIQRVPHPFIGPEGVRVLLVFRGITGFVGLDGTYFALQYLSLSDVTVLSFLVPMCTAISGSFFLKETFTKREALAGVCSLFGVVLIARPHFLFGSPDGSSTIEEKHRTFGIGIALSGVVGSTGAMTSIRAIGQRAHPMHLLASFSIQSVIAASVIMVILRQPFVFPTRLAWLGLLAVIGILGFGSQILLTMGFQRETAGRASMALYTQIIFASILERIFFQTRPTVLSFIGALIIMSSAIYVALTKKSPVDPGKPDGTNQLDEIYLEEGVLQSSKAGCALDEGHDESLRSSLSEDP